MNKIAKVSPGHERPDKYIIQTTKSVTPPASTVPQEKCLACHNYGPLGKIIKCQECGFKTHAGTFGVIAESLDVDNWLCEICQNDKVQEASLDTSCLLCPKVRHDPKDGIYPPADTFLRAQKPTEGQGWVHVICSVFIPELTFSDTTRLRLVEGISVINPHRWLTVSPPTPTNYSSYPQITKRRWKFQPCSLCSERGGAVVRCCDCSKEFHVSCAWKAGHRFGFEIQTVRQSKRDSTTIANWNGDSGNMVPVISCKEHSSRRAIHEMCETNDVGEVGLPSSRSPSLGEKELKADFTLLIDSTPSVLPAIQISSSRTHPCPPPQSPPSRPGPRFGRRRLGFLAHDPHNEPYPMLTLQIQLLAHVLSERGEPMGVS